MKPDRELIEKFLRDQCTDAEAETIRQYFEQNPGELEKHIPLREWFRDEKKRLNTIVSERILHGIRKGYKSPQKAAGVRLLVRLSVAASFIGIIILAGTRLLTESGSRPPENGVAVNSTAVTSPELKRFENKTRQALQQRLPDGSVATIYPNSSLEYLPDFEKNKREVYLKGKAFFKVSKDAARPFTVYASGIATTALGTQFIVSELDNTESVSVHLLEGSVKVWPQHAAGKSSFVVLRPGDRLTVSEALFDKYALVRSPEKGENGFAPEVSVEDKPVNKENRLVFKNGLLKDVFKRMEEKFGVTIIFNAGIDADQKLFTGTFLETDSLEFVCRTICQLQGLQYNIEGKTVTISTP